MTSARHRQLAEHRVRRNLVRLALPATAAALVTGSVIGVAVARDDASQRTAAIARATAPMTANVQEDSGTSQGATGASPGASGGVSDRTQSISRSAKRVTLQKKPKVVDKEYRTADLNVWPAPQEKGKPLEVLEEGGRVAVTGITKEGFAQILHAGQVRWVNAEYLAEKKPAASAADGAISSAPCPTSAGIESGITSNTARVYRAVCAAFPQVTSYGGYRGDGEHSDGHAIDIMVSGATGQAIADYLRAKSGELGVDNIIWSQQIWTNQRAGEGWRGMEDRGSTTANHYDHVHVRVF